ncbi:MAG TPA: hypothetical protein V6D17_03365 [Candidatus Obscuribacterales bacterium]
MRQKYLVMYRHPKLAAVSPAFTKASATRFKKKFTGRFHAQPQCVQIDVWPDIGTFRVVAYSRKLLESLPAEFLGFKRGEIQKYQPKKVG